MTIDENIKSKIESISQCIDNKFPRNIISICEKLNIQVQETSQLPNNTSGLIYKNKENSGYSILINSNQSAGRKSFTIAHELGHFLLHKEILDKDSEIVSVAKGVNSDSPVYITRQDITATSSQEYRKLETEANKFAAEILMPEKEFLKQCICQNSIDDIASFFGVSISAATIRADRLGGLYFL